MNIDSFKAIYGVFDIEMKPTVFIDVTAIVIEKFKAGRKIIIPKTQKFNDAFTDPDFGKVKYLQIGTNGRKYNIIEDNYLSDIIIDLDEKVKQLKIVYYAYINKGSNWLGIISGQLLQMKSYGIFDEAEVYVHITDTEDHIEEVVMLIKTIVPTAIINKSTFNQFEYAAIRLVYDIANEEPDSLIIYFHSKGMSYNIHSRKIDEITLLTLTFENWRKKIQIFENENINKIGLFPAIGSDSDNEKPGTRGGWIWYNFWYARASYIMNCDEPFISEDRYYFEHWLGLQNGSLIINSDCYNLYNKSKKTYFTPSEAGQGLLDLVMGNMVKY